ncbi:hypothetical protein NQ314_013395 [Rhamnusium bicolor]|uniref:PHD-type domain-containing protein n=1 Tax=Rhamnusium bicolor TaxID=1586634 RepID=A0AAV8X738_9CUCU|nr:hypothetical protein NQ314_013395 [Rhamnusium bicolor]
MKIRKGNLQCSACEEDLISDVEDEEEKNIGCDKCPRWFHMKCTEFLGMSYDEAASKEYISFMCS